MNGVPTDSGHITDRVRQALTDVTGLSDSHKFQIEMGLRALQVEPHEATQLEVDDVKRLCNLVQSIFPEESGVPTNSTTMEAQYGITYNDGVTHLQGCKSHQCNTTIGTRNGHHHTCKCKLCGERAQRKRKQSHRNEEAPEYVTIPTTGASQQGERRTRKRHSPRGGELTFLSNPTEAQLYRLFIICGFQGGGLADVAVTEALQSLYTKVRFQLLEGWSFEIDRKAIDMNVRINTP